LALTTNQTYFATYQSLLIGNEFYYSYYMNGGKNVTLFHNLMILSMLVITVCYGHCYCVAGRNGPSALEAKVIKKQSLTYGPGCLPWEADSRSTSQVISYNLLIQNINCRLHSAFLV